MKPVNLLFKMTTSKKILLATATIITFGIAFWGYKKWGKKSIPNLPNNSINQGTINNPTEPPIVIIPEPIPTPTTEQPIVITTPNAYDFAKFEKTFLLVNNSLDLYYVLKNDVLNVNELFKVDFKEFKKLSSSYNISFPINPIDTANLKSFFNSNRVLDNKNLIQIFNSQVLIGNPIIKPNQLSFDYQLGIIK